MEQQKEREVCADLTVWEYFMKKTESTQHSTLLESFLSLFACLSLRWILFPLIRPAQASIGLSPLWQEQQQWACDTSPLHRVNLPRAQITRDTHTHTLSGTLQNTTPPSPRPQNTKWTQKPFKWFNFSPLLSFQSGRLISMSVITHNSLIPSNTKYTK